MVVVCFVVFFFFKQKTAYEMRISDWSSDVCSSDLIDHGLKLDLRDILQTARPDATGVVDEDVEAAEGGKCLFERRGTAFGRRDKIGRASCRERVCQYV